MASFTLDFPLLVGGLFTLLWLRVRRPANVFQVACQVVGTFWAQYSFVVNWSLAKLVPFFAATSLTSKRVKYAVFFFPFILYVFISGIISSLFWNVSPNTSFAYGHGRLYVQLLVFISLILTTKALSLTLSEPSGIKMLWKALMIIGLIHGGATIYQYTASYWGLPHIGISRAHGLTLNEGEGDVAAFAVDGGIDILRPGGLAGEPKTAGILFGLVLTVYFFVGLPSEITRKWKRLSKLSAFLSLLGFFGAFSTSAFIGFAIALLVLLLFGLIKGKLSILFKLIVVFSVVYVSLNYFLQILGFPSLADLLYLRTFERLGSGTMDPPVEAAVGVLSRNNLILFFGTGLGGGSFYIQDFLKESFEYALAPNIGFVLLLFETGLIGISLLLGPFLFLVSNAMGRNVKLTPLCWEKRFLLSLGVSAMAFMLSGSGIALGYPLAIASVLGALNYKTT